MNINCITSKDTCFDQTIPIGNHSAEDPDQDLFISHRYVPNPPDPPLNRWNTWYGSCCGIVVCTSNISQADADLCAQRQFWECITDPPNNNNPNFTAYYNSAQTGSYTCPDGNVFYYTVAYGVYAGLSQYVADANALALANQLAYQQHICIGDLSENCCLDEAYSSSVSIDSAVLLIEAEITGGALPPGISMTLNSAFNTLTFSGTPTTSGTFNFYVTVTNFNGGYMTKYFALTVRQFSPDTLADGTVGASYSDTLSVTPVVGTATFTVVDGDLPDGLTLDSDTGEISGTPTVADTFTFTVEMDDGT